MSRNGLTIWNVRAIPASATWSGRMDDTSRPLNLTCPSVGRRKPDSTLKASSCQRR